MYKCFPILAHNALMNLQTSLTILQYPDYNPSELPLDHALIELTEVPSGDNIATVFADDVGGDSWVGVEDCWITGWGETG